MAQPSLETPVGNVAGTVAADISSNMMLGSVPRPELPEPRQGQDVRAVIAEVVTPALATGRCIVPFSGGRDSAAMLAVVTEVARKRGLPDPIPVTARYTEVTGTDERQAQELVVKHLRLAEWERFEVADEFQIVGPVAQRTLRRHGVLFPAAAYMMQPMFDLAAGGALLLGQGPNDFFYYWRFASIADVLLGERRLARADLAPIAFAMLPRRVRARQVLRRLPDAPPWLRPEDQARLQREIAARVASAPMRCDSAVRLARGQRCYDGAWRSLEALAAAAGSTVLLPFYDPRVVGAVASTAGWRGWGSRERGLVALVAGQLPREILARRENTRIGRVLFGDHTREFAGRWSGGGLDDLLVDTDALRELWLGETADQDWRSSALMQLAWLHDDDTQCQQTARAPEQIPALTT